MLIICICREELLDRQCVKLVICICRGEIIVKSLGNADYLYLSRRTSS